jgi:surface protein
MTIKYVSGRDRFLGWGVPTPIPIAYDPADHAGVLLYGADGVLYYSDGTEWKPPIVTPPIARPYALNPTTSTQQRLLRLSDFLSSFGLTQVGVTFEASLSPNMTSPFLSETITSTTVDTYALETSEPLTPGQTFYWRGKYLGTGGAESAYSLPFAQVFPAYIENPTTLRNTGAELASFLVTPYLSPFSLPYNNTQWEVYSNPAGTPPQAWTSVNSSNEILVPTTLTPGQTYYWRMRYASAGGIVSDWTPLQAYVQPVSEMRLRFDTNLIAGTTVGIPLTTTATPTRPFSVVINWGDGVTETKTVGGVHSHVYAAEGIYNVTVTGNCDYAGNTNGAEWLGVRALTHLESFGFGLGLKTLNFFLRGSRSTLVQVPASLPPTVTLIASMFRESAANPNIGSWDVQYVTTANDMFSGATAFNNGGSTSINNWRFNALTNALSMFSGATAFNQPIGDWGMANVTTMSNMFINATSFNQNIGNWNAGKVTSFNGMFASATAFNNGNVDTINNWDTSSATDMSSMFSSAVNFNQPIGSWNTGNVLYMNSMFLTASVFNQNIGNWNTSKVIAMANMFYAARAFNNGGNLSINNWDVSKVTNTAAMFRETWAFDQPIGSWNVALVTVMNSMFQEAREFNQNIGSWNVTAAAAGSAGTATGQLFYGALKFNNGGSPSINNWNVTGIRSTAQMFFGCTAFNQPLGNWNVSLVTNFSGMFRQCPVFNQSLSSWNTSSATDFSVMFRDSPAFNNGGNAGINGWNTANVTDMSNMFYNTAFNQPIGSWNTANVTNMSFMFQSAIAFNQDITAWNVSKVTNMSSMFGGGVPFNQPIGVWNTAALTNTAGMFNSCPFNQNIGSWNVTNLTSASVMFINSSGLSTANYDALLIGWEAQAVRNNVAFSGSPSKYSAGAAAAARARLIADHAWTITDGGLAP